MVLSMLVNSLYNIVDSFFVAQISEEAMTALSLVYPVQNFINAVGIGFGVGINAVIAFYLGAGDYEKADQSATQGLVLAVIHGVVMTVCCITIMPVFLRIVHHAGVGRTVKKSAAFIVVDVVPDIRQPLPSGIVLQKDFLRRDLSRSVFAKQCAIRIDKQQKERYNNVVIDNDVII